MSYDMDRAATAAGLRQLADFIEAHPDIPVPTYLREPNVWCPRGAEQVQVLIRAALAAGVEVTKHHSDQQRNVGLRFGPFEAMALINKSEVCERVVTGTRVVQVPDPAYIPPETPMVDQTVEITEWRCRPLLAPAEA